MARELLMRSVELKAGGSITRARPKVITAELATELDPGIRDADGLAFGRGETFERQGGAYAYSNQPSGFTVKEVRVSGR
jgi:hypothetical protein